MKKILAAVMIVFLNCVTSFAHAENVYLTSLADIPLMAGMTHSATPEATSFTFDKAEGRIVDETVVVKGISQQDVAKFYHDALPPLGWVPVASANSAQRFVRNGEQLIVKWEEKKDGVKQLRFSLSPYR